MSFPGPRAEVPGIWDRMKRIRTNKKSLARNAWHRSTDDSNEDGSASEAIALLRSLAEDNLSLGNGSKAREYLRRAERVDLRRKFLVEQRVRRRRKTSFSTSSPPADAVVLYRLKERSHKIYIENRFCGSGRDGEPAIFVRNEVDRLEAEGRLYNPFDDGRFHDWATNLIWLEKAVALDRDGGAIGGGSSSPPPVFLLTALPVNVDRIYRRGARGRKFSAYAREVAYLLLMGGYVGAEEYVVGDQHVQCMRRLLQERGGAEEAGVLSQLEHDIASGVVRNDSSIPREMVLCLFGSRGITVDM